jgi:hypothetical protein
MVTTSRRHHFQLAIAIAALIAITGGVVWGLLGIGYDVREKLHSNTKVTNVYLYRGVMTGETMTCADRPYAKAQGPDAYLDCGRWGSGEFHRLDVTFIGEGPKDKAYFWACKKEPSGLTCRVE